MLNDVLAHLESDHEAALERLLDYLRIASVSTDPAYAEHIASAADWTAERLRECGLTVELLPTAGHPAVLAANDGPADAPHVLFYGHYDVQPPDPVEKWTTPPFEPRVRDGAGYARGASDDKGQVSCFLEAIRAWHAVAGSIPVRLTVLIEGEEEIGSTNLEPVIEHQRDRLAADIAVVSDTSMWTEGSGRSRPAITYGLRGLVYFDVKLHGPARDLHSGVYGGTIANPVNELVKTLGGLFDENHHIAIPGFYDDVAEVTEAERRIWAELEFSDEQWAQSIGMNAVYGEAGFTSLERRWARPSGDVNGVYGGYMGEGAKTVIPTFAGAKVSFRLAPDQDPAKVADSFRRWLEGRTPPGCRWQITEFGRAVPVMIDLDSPYIAAASRAMATGCGEEPVLVREGATVPVVGSFKQLLGMETLMLGFGKHDDAIHSPNEKFELACFNMGCRSHAALIDELSRMGAH